MNKKKPMLDTMLNADIIINDLKRLIPTYSPETIFNLLMMTEGSLLFDIVCSEIIEADKIATLEDYLNNIIY